MKKISIIILALFASTTTLADGIQAALDFNHQLNGLSGQFEQTVISGKNYQSTGGTFSVLRPGYFKWQYQKPYQQLIVGNGDVVWLYDQDLQQATRKKQSGFVSSSPAAILADKKTLKNDYVLKNDGHQNGVDFVIATPKSHDSEFRNIRLGFQGKQLKSMEVDDSFGNKTTIRFFNLSFKNNLKAKDFQFIAPKGVDVLTD